MQYSIWEPRQLNQYGDEGTGWLYRVLFPEGKVSISSEYWNSPWGLTKPTEQLSSTCLLHRLELVGAWSQLLIPPSGKVHV